MELLLIKGFITLSEETLLLANICNGLSLGFTSIACTIFLLNLDQLSSIQHLINWPRKKPTVILYSMLMIFYIGRQIFVLAALNSLKIRNSDFGTNVALQIMMIYFSLMFYCMKVALYLRAVRDVVYALQRHGKGKIHWRYYSVVIVPTILVVLFISECYSKDKQWTQQMFDRTYVKVILLVLMGFTALIGFGSTITILTQQILNFRSLDLSFSDGFTRLSQANRLRNIFMTSVIFTVFLSNNINFALVEFNAVQPKLVLVDSVFHLLLGLHFLVLEWWFHDKELRTPFKWQRQREVRKLAQKSRHVAFASHKSSESLAVIQ
uniref:Uncharacterized protein n=1 Tax=Clytia hemisphaerica TaxID=252671 RepID=A0A7M5TZJ4_9CNID